MIESNFTLYLLNLNIVLKMFRMSDFVALRVELTTSYDIDDAKSCLFF